MTQKLTIFDTTLRDGAQAQGISFSNNDKKSIIYALDSIDIDYIEAGNPYSSEQDLELFCDMQGINLKHAKLVAFSSTCRKELNAQDDLSLSALIKTGTQTVAVFGKASTLHVEDVLNVSLYENLRMIEDSVKYLVANGRSVIYDAEHFFDGYKLDSLYAIETLKTALNAGAATLTLCDTNGGTLPFETENITKEIKKLFPNIEIGIHTHNDSALAVANSIAAVRAGATHVQGTLSGIGERCGNACLSSLIPTLQLKMGFDCIPQKSLEKLTQTCLVVSEISNMPLSSYMPYVGKSAFAHKAGMHVSGVIKNSQTFEHINPSLVGNERKIVISEMAGKQTLKTKIAELMPDIDIDIASLKLLLKKLKEMESAGFKYDAANASFELFARRTLNLYTPHYELVNFKIISEQPSILDVFAVAVVKVKVLDKFKLVCAEGDGPVNAMDKALRSALTAFYPCIKSMHLIDFKVRVIETKGGTDAVVRVLIESTDGNEVWTTVGVSPDVINASFMALNDSIEYKLFKFFKKRG